MFTPDTLVALAALHQLSLEALTLKLTSVSAPGRQSYFNLIPEATARQLVSSGTTHAREIDRAVHEGLKAAAPLFVGTPFEESMTDIVKCYGDPNGSGMMWANNELYKLPKLAGEWLVTQRGEDRPQ